MYKPEIPISALEATRSPMIRSSASSLMNIKLYNKITLELIYNIFKF